MHKKENVTALPFVDGNAGVSSPEDVYKNLPCQAQGAVLRQETCRELCEDDKGELKHRLTRFTLISGLSGQSVDAYPPCRHLCLPGAQHE